MEHLITKLKQIWFPQLIITVITICVYSSLHWLLFIKNTIFIVDEDIINLLVPGALTPILLLIFLLPRLRLIRFNLKDRNPKIGYIFIACIAMWVPFAISQSYLVSATGKLTRLNHISQIQQLPLTRYYWVKNYYVDKNQARIQPSFNVSGKHNQNYDMTINVVCPVFDNDDNLNKPIIRIDKNLLVVIDGKVSSKDSLESLDPRKVKSAYVLNGAAAIIQYGNRAENGAVIVKTGTVFYSDEAAFPSTKKNMPVPAAWITKKYYETISNKLSDQEKDKEFKYFSQQSEMNFNQYAFKGIIYMQRMAEGSERRAYLKIVKANNHVTILEPKFESFESRSDDILFWLLISFLIGSVFFILMLLARPLKDYY